MAGCRRRLDIGGSGNRIRRAVARRSLRHWDVHRRVVFGCHWLLMMLCQSATCRSGETLASLGDPNRSAGRLEADGCEVTSADDSGSERGVVDLAIPRPTAPGAITVDLHAGGEAAAEWIEGSDGSADRRRGIVQSGQRAAPG
jgi:hypothetical protein